MSLNKPLLALVIASSVGFAGTALAQTASNCVSDLDCAHGYTCQPSAVIATPAPAACAPDTDCKTTDGAGAGGGSGVSVTLSTCQPGPCVTDSDCGTSMVCHTETSTMCSGGTTPARCPANTKCDSPVVDTPPTCTTTTVSACTFRWQLPCSADAECGDGFVCQPSVYGSCSGGSPASGGTSGSAGTGNVSGAGGSSASDAPLPTPDTCTTTTSFPGSCHPAATTCATDTDCPASWLCQDSVTRGAPGIAVSGSAGEGGGASEVGSVAPSAGAAADVAVVPSAKMCVAPNSPPIRGKDGGNGGTTGNTGGTGSTGSTGGTETGSPDSPPGTGGTVGGATGPTAAGTATGTGGSTGGLDSKLTGGPDDGGCSVMSPAGAPSDAGAAALLALLGLGLVTARRRRG